MRDSVSILARALLALLLMVGFYGLALAIAGGLLYIPYAELIYLHRVHARLAIPCVVGAFAILGSIVPRLDRFTLPGPELEAPRHPRLFAELGAIARAVGQRMPVEVYLVPDVNAWVQQRGGIMGLGGRRVMGLGLPLLQALTVSQLRAVMAHEYGHFSGGDTLIGPWIYKTRAAIGRTLQTLARQGSSALQIPFMLYGRLFLQVTHAVSRHQEYQADQLAARTMGRKALVDGLVNTQGAALAFGPYLQNEYLPLLQGGLRPPLASGFLSFMRTPRIHELLSEAVTREVEEGRPAHALDTHPPLADRIAALEELPDGAPPAHDPPALTLLDDVEEMEEALVLMVSNADRALALKAVSWHDVPERFYVPLWENMARRNARDVDGIRAPELPDLVTRLARRAASVAQGSHAADDPGASEVGAAGAALALALRQRGFELAMMPGEPCRLRKGDAVVEPFAVAARLASGELAAADWVAQCAALSISDLRLSDIGRAHPGLALSDVAIDERTGLPSSG